MMMITIQKVVPSPKPSLEAALTAAAAFTNKQSPSKEPLPPKIDADILKKLSKARKKMNKKERDTKKRQKLRDDDDDNDNNTGSDGN